MSFGRDIGRRNSDFALSNLSVDNLSNISKNRDSKLEKDRKPDHKYNSSVHEYNSIGYNSKRKNSEYSEEGNN